MECRPRYELSAEAMRDARVHVVHDDVLRVLEANASGFDAIMLDTDNGPDGMLMSDNAPLYAPEGVAVTFAALRPGGSVVYWSVGDDPRFVERLRRTGLRVRSLHVRAHDTTGPMHTLYAVTR